MQSLLLGLAGALLDGTTMHKGSMHSDDGNIQSMSLHMADTVELGGANVALSVLPMLCVITGEEDIVDDMIVLTLEAAEVDLGDTGQLVIVGAHDVMVSMSVIVVVDVVL